MSIQFAVINPSTGEIVGGIKPSDPTAYLTTPLINGMLYIDISNEPFDISTAISSKMHTLNGFVDKPVKPSDYYNWDSTTASWVFDGERLSKDIRNKRTIYLGTSDWTQVPDAPLTTEQVEAYRSYRQQLRDLPSNLTGNEISLEDVAWPILPS